jgi:hypothetical protein
MSRDNDLTPFIIGICVGMAIFGMAIALMPGPFREGKAALAECEKTLPRNVECKLIAVPVVDPNAAP